MVPTQLDTVIFRKDVSIRVKYDVEDEIRLISSNQHTLRGHLNAFTPRFTDHNQARRFSIACLQCTKLKDLEGGLQLQRWGLGHGISLRHVLAGNLYFDDLWLNRLIRFGFLEDSAGDAENQRSAATSDTLGTILDPKALQHDIDHSLNALRIELRINDEWSKVKETVLETNHPSPDQLGRGHYYQPATDRYFDPSLVTHKFAAYETED